MEVIPTGGGDSLNKLCDNRPITPPGDEQPYYRGSPYQLRSRTVGGSSTSPSPPPPEASSSAYHILSAAAPLGSGGYGTVVQARHLATGELVAAKVVPHKPPFAKPEALRDEYALLVRCAHAHVVRAHGIEEVPGVTTIYTELCTTDLFALTRSRGGLSEAEARQYIGQLLLAAEHLHALGVCHRDLKLENALLDLTGNVKLCDFGLAQILPAFSTPDDRWLTEICGSRSYCAPEVLAGGGYDAYAADVWSLGICLFAMCAGFFPLDQASAADWRFERLRGALDTAQRVSLAHTIFGFYDRRCTFSAELIDLIDAMLALLPLCRISASTALRAPFVAGPAAVGMDVEMESSVAPRYRVAQVPPPAATTRTRTRTNTRAHVCACGAHLYACRCCCLSRHRPLLTCALPLPAHRSRCSLPSRCGRRACCAPSPSRRSSRCTHALSTARGRARSRRRPSSSASRPSAMARPASPSSCAMPPNVCRGCRGS